LNDQVDNPTSPVADNETNERHNERQRVTPTASPSGIKPVWSRMLGGLRLVAVNLAIPILLAWLVVSVLRHGSSPPRSAATSGTPESFGPISLKLKLPGTAGGIPEPILVCGRAGNASLVYIRLLHRHRAQLGVEFWGLGSFESEPFLLSSADAEVDVTCYIPAFFPKEGDPYWGNLSPRLQQIRKTQYILTANGVVRLRGPVRYEQPAHPDLYFGSNPLGGSFVSNSFTGRILHISLPH
jgi:hypothetical protein